MRVKVGKETREKGEWRGGRRPERKERGGGEGDRRERRVEVGKETGEKGEWMGKETREK